MASIGSSVSANDGFFEALKKMYSPEKTKLRVELNHPTWKDIKKVAIGEGQNYTYSIGLTYGSGFSNSLSSILTSSGSTSGNPASGAKVANIVCNTGDDYAVLELHNKFLARSAKADASFVEQLKWNVDASLKGMGIGLSQKLFGAGNGVLATCTAVTPGSITTLTLSKASDVKFFTTDMVLAMGTISGTTVTLDTVYPVITSINESTGVLTFSAVTATLANTVIGLRGVLGQTTNASGFAAWLPTSAPSGTAIGSLVTSNVTRANYQAQLGGFRVDDTTRPIDECAYLLAQKIQERGGRPDRIVCSYNTFNKMAVKAWNKIVPMNKAEATSTGVASLGLVTPHGTIPFVVDSSCPDSACYMLTMDTWRIVHLSDALPQRISDAAGAGQMFPTLDDSVQIRYRAWWNLVCLSPIDNGVFTVDSTNF